MGEVTMMRRLYSWTKRVERLEKARQLQAGNSVGMAIIETADFPCAERHLVIHPNAGGAGSRFKEMPGPGPQLADFGSFKPVVYMSKCEMES
jgi:hypothetical protein